jgi:L-alanine-DL-glutamate epimerase-like enolase superfamily enzyme
VDDRAGPVTVELWAVAAPLPRPVITPAGTFDTYHHLVARALDDDGRAGWGLAAGVTAAEVETCTERALALLATTGPGVDGLIAVEEIEEARTVTPADRWSRWAASALATAGWDLRARREDVACADLWGRRPGTEALDAYASGLFLSTDLEGLDAEARRHREAGFRTVKVRVGLSLGDDLERLAVVRRHFPGPEDVAVDAVEAWGVDAALAFVAEAGPLRWVEDPVPYSDLGSLMSRLSVGAAFVAAGESLTERTELLELRRRDGIDAVLLDVQQVGGPARFLRAAEELAALGARIGAHVFTPVSTHLLACVDDPLPVEVFDWSDALFTAAPAPGADGHLPVVGPGIGTDLDLTAVERLGTLVHTELR